MKTIKVKDIDPDKHVVIEKKIFDALLGALNEVRSAAYICSARDPLNEDYWFTKQRIVNTALRIVNTAMAQGEGKL